MTLPTLWRKRIAFVVTILPAKSGSDVMFVYNIIRDL